MSVEIIGKKQIAEHISSRIACPEDEARRILEETIQSIREELTGGKKVHLDNLATLVAGNGKGDVHDDALIEKIVQKASVTRERAAAAYQAALESIRDHLLKGVEVQLTDFATLSVGERKAKIIRDPKSGQKMIAPSRKILQFAAAAPLIREVNNQSISFIPSQDMQDRLAKMKTATILLLVPEYDFFVKTIEYHFNRAGWKVEVATGSREAFDKLERGNTYLILLDAGMPGAQEICERVKCKRDTSLIPLILMYPKGTDTKRPDRFRICGDEQVIQPFEVKNLLTLAETELARSSEEEAIFKQEVTFQLPTEDESIDKANEMAKKLFEASGLTEKDQVALCAAFREALGNAAQHGNKHRRDKPLEVLYLLDNEKITVAVTDSGQGFDHQRYLDQGKQGNVLAAARESHKAGKLGGLGIMLMLKCVDKLEYNDKGNVITLTKYIRKAAG